MNAVMLKGNLASDIVVRPLAEGKCVGNFSLAVDRGFRKDSGTDFYRVTVWNGAATNMEKFVRKGDEVTVQGHLRSSSYEKTFDCGKLHKVYVTEIHADEIDYGSRSRRNAEKAPAGRGR